MSLHTVSRVQVPKAVVEQTLMTLREYGSQQLERFVFWAGVVSPTTASVGRLFVPAQKSYNRNGMCWVDIPAEEIRKMMVDCSVAGLTLIGQVHSHPTRAYHSERDDALAVLRLPGSVSIVVPNFAAAPFAGVERYACYRRNTKGQWDPLDAAQARNLIKVEEGAWL